jgi:hypothetical protein
MIEIGVLALLFRIAGFGYQPVLAWRVVAAGLEQLHALATDPRTYAGTAEVRPSSCQRVVVVRVSAGPRRVLRYTWMFSPGRGTTQVDLAVQVEAHGPAVRLALLLGGRRHLRGDLDTMLATLAQAAADAAEQIPAAPRAPAPAVLHHAA